MLKKILALAIVTGFSLPSHAMEPVNSNNYRSEEQQMLDEALCKAIHTQDLKLVILSLQRGANPNIPIHSHAKAHTKNYSDLERNEKVTPLEFLTRHKDCNYQLCKLLLEHGANPEDKANVHLIVNITRYAPLDKQFALYNLLFEYGARLPEVFPSPHQYPIIEYRPFVRIVKFWGFETEALKHAITSPIFNPKLDLRHFASCKRIVTTLLTLKHCCPDMPKDLCIYLIKNHLPEDLQLMTRYGKISSIKEENAHTIPMKIVHMLIKQGQLDADKTVAALKENHIACIKPYLKEALFVYQEELKMLAPTRPASFEKRKQILNPEKIDEHWGQCIEENMRRRLGLSQDVLSSKKVGDTITCSLCAIQ